MQVITRAEARTAKLTHYFTGQPCRRGHIAQRFVCNAQCSLCLRGWEKNNPEKVRAKERSWVDRNRAADREKILRRNARKLEATPAWANLNAIQMIYEQAEQMGADYQVDHIVPLVSDLVCGLHCEANLQILTRFENQSKSNRFWPDMF